MRPKVARRVVLVLPVAALTATATRLAAPTEAHPTKLSPALFCGTERWHVKTLQDRPPAAGEERHGRLPLEPAAGEASTDRPHPF
jgi:hypothetical protein